MTPSPLKVKQNLWGAYIDIMRTLFMTQFSSFSFPFLLFPCVKVGSNDYLS